MHGGPLHVTHFDTAARFNGFFVALCARSLWHSIHGCFLSLSISLCFFFRGNPHMFDTFWRENGDSARTVTEVPAPYRTGYDGNGREAFYSLKLLEDSIREVHGLVGNAATEGKHLVIGTGSIQLYGAALHVLTEGVEGKPAVIFAPTPYYEVFFCRSRTFVAASGRVRIADVFPYRRTRPCRTFSAAAASSGRGTVTCPRSRATLPRGRSRS